jgi:hypothetical protein
MLSDWDDEKERLKLTALLRTSEFFLFTGVALALGSIWGSLIIETVAPWPLGIIVGTALGFGGYFTATRFRREYRHREALNWNSTPTVTEND